MSTIQTLLEKALEGKTLSKDEFSYSGSELKEFIKQLPSKWSFAGPTWAVWIFWIFVTTAVILFFPFVAAIVGVLDVILSYSLPVYWNIICFLILGAVFLFSLFKIDENLQRSELKDRKYVYYLTEEVIYAEFGHAVYATALQDTEFMEGRELYFFSNPVVGVFAVPKRLVSQSKWLEASHRTRSASQRSAK